MEGLRKVEAKPKDRMPVIVAIAEASAIAIPVKHDNPTPVEHYNPTTVEHYNLNYNGKSVELIQQKPPSSKITKKNRNILITVPVTLGFVYILYMLKKHGRITNTPEFKDPYKYMGSSILKISVDLRHFQSDIKKKIYEYYDCSTTIKKFKFKNLDPTSSIETDELMGIVSKKMKGALIEAGKLLNYIQENKEELTAEDYEYEYEYEDAQELVSQCRDDIEKFLEILEMVINSCVLFASYGYKFDNDCVNMFSQINDFIERLCEVFGIEREKNEEINEKLNEIKEINEKRI